MIPKFEIGQFTYDDVEYLIEPGSRGKVPGADMKLYFRTPGSFEWHLPRMSHTFVCVDFYHQNEERIFPPSMGYLGGKKWTSAVSRVLYTHGWLRESEIIENQVALKNLKLD